MYLVKLTATMDLIWQQYDALMSVTTEEKRDPMTCKCGGHKVFLPDSLPVCTSCGVVDTHYVDDSPEWTSGVDESGNVNDPSRCGMAGDTTLFSESWGMGTVMNTAYGNYEQKRIARINFHGSMNHKDRSLFHAYKQLDEIGKDILHVPDNVLREAKILYRKFNSEKLTRGAVRTGIKANCIFYACKLNNIPRTTQEVADAFGIPTRDLSRTSDMFRSLAVKEVGKNIHGSDIIKRLLNGFDVSREVKMKCVKFSERIQKCVGLMGKNPKSVAAVVIFKVTKSPKSTIVEKCGISMPTLNKIETIIDKYLVET